MDGEPLLDKELSEPGELGGSESESLERENFRLKKVFRVKNPGGS